MVTATSRFLQTRRHGFTIPGTALLVFGVAVTSGAEAGAQTILAGVAVQGDVQRFSGDHDLNRLDGSALGWTVHGGAAIVPHVVARAEVAQEREIRNDQSFTLDVDGRLATIRSSLVHRTRTVSALGGFTHASRRVRLSYLAGISFTRFERVFTTNAPALVLDGTPSPTPPAVTKAATDDFRALVVGADAQVRVAPHLVVIAGVRRQPLELDADISGHGTRFLVGAAWIR